MREPWIKRYIKMLNPCRDPRMSAALQEASRDDDERDGLLAAPWGHGDLEHSGRCKDKGSLCRPRKTGP